MIRVLINGFCGKMGQVVSTLIENNDDFVLVAGFDRENNGKYAIPVYTDISEIKEKIDVIIDFSVPAATFKILDYALANNIPTVIATTGFTDEENYKISEIAKQIPIFKSANMSYDINLLKHLLMNIAPKLKDTDIEITEVHHNRKIDSPSGTAMLLANSINESLGNTHHIELDRLNKKEKRNKNEIGISSIRGGNIVGEHTVQFFGEFETLEIKHTSYSRNVFAEGALKAAKYLVKQNPGLYNMDNI